MAVSTTDQQDAHTSPGLLGDRCRQRPATGPDGAFGWPPSTGSTPRVSSGSRRRRSSQSLTDPFNLLPNSPQTSQSLGSGFVIDKAGHIVTNYDVIAGREEGQVTFSGTGRLARAHRRQPTLATDVAILKIARACARAHPARARQFGCRWSSVTRSTRSAIPSASRARLTAGSSAPCSAQIEAPNVVADRPTRSIPMPRSITATRAAR